MGIRRLEARYALRMQIQGRNDLGELRLVLKIDLWNPSFLERLKSYRGRSRRSSLSRPNIAETQSTSCADGQKSLFIEVCVELETVFEYRVKSYIHK